MSQHLINLIGSLCSMASLVAVVVTGVRHRRLERQRNLIESAPQEDQARLIEAVLDRFAVDTAKLSSTQQSKIALEMLRQRGERFRWGLIASTGGFVLSLAAVLTAYVLQAPSVYQIRITVLGLDGQPTDDTELRSSVDGVMKQLPGGWELEIPAARRPLDGRAVIWATQDFAFLSGRSEVTLGDDYRLTVMVQLEKKESRVHGLVIDAEGLGVAGVLVSVRGFEEEAVTTSADGRFELPAHAADGEMVRLQMHGDERVVEELVMAGQASVRLEWEDKR